MFSKKLRHYFESYLDQLKALRRSSITLQKRRNFLYGALSHSVSEIKIKNLRLADLEKIIEAGKTHGKYGTQEAMITFRCFLRYLSESGVHVPINWRDIKVPTVQHGRVEYLEGNELGKIRKLIDKNTLVGLRFRTLIEVLLDTGMRISEVLSLDSHGIDWKNREALVINAKSKEWETVYFTARSIGWLKRYLASRKDSCPALFVANRKRMKTVTARYWMGYYAKKLKFKKRFCNHIFRRTFITTLLRNRVDLKTVQALARHRSERTTLKHYAGISQKHVKREHARVMNRQ